MAATSRDDDPVHLYLTEIGAHPLLSRDDEVRLAKTIEAGVAAADEPAGGDPSPARRRTLRRRVHEGELAARRFTEANLRLVVSIAKRYQHSGVALLDLIQEGNLGLLHAVKKFDHTKGFKFSTYATWWIRQAITRGISNTGRTTRIPAHAEDHARRVARTAAGFLADDLTRLVGRLHGRDRLIVEWRYGLGSEGPLTLDEIGSRLGLTRERVRQLENRNLLRLAQRAAADGLDEHLLDA